MNANVPSLQTTRAWTLDTLKSWKALGYESIQYQAQNGHLTYEYDLSVAGAAGMRPEVWGVSYNQADFRRDGLLLGAKAVKLGARRVVVNAEMCAKFTRRMRGMRPIVEALREAGWTGPVDLSTLGSPIDPLAHDFEIDTQTFLETGGTIYAQAYVNAHGEYHPARCVQYWTRFVPRERLNLTLGLYDATSEGGGRLTGAWYAEALKALSWGRGISIFMPELMLPTDLFDLGGITLPAPEPEPQPDVSPAANRVEAMRLCDEAVELWRSEGLREDVIDIQRLTLAWRVLNMKQVGAHMRSLRDVLDAAEAPKP